MSEKIIRDPVHDVIAFDLAKPIDTLLFQLLNAVEFQRLRRIRQLGMASLAYPGAEHTRYSHSVGVMQTARKMLDQLQRSFNIPQQDMAACLAGALLHDLGHGPFSHVFERISGVHHESLTQRVVLDPGSEINRILVQHDTSLPQRIVQMITCQPRRTFLCDILSSQLDADRLDYLLRDNLMTGSQYGSYDLGWLLHSVTIDAKSDRLAIADKGISAVEAYLQARYHMYHNVYFHKVVRSGEGMLRLALSRAKDLAAQGRLTWPADCDAVHMTLLGQPLSNSQFTQLDDVSLLHCLKLWTGADDAPLAALCDGLLYRRLLKSIDMDPAADRKQIDATVQSVADAIAAAGGEPACEMFYDEPTDTPYEASGIFIKDDSGAVREFSAVSPMVDALNRQLWFRRLHVAARWRDLAMKIVQKQP